MQKCLLNLTTYILPHCMLLMVGGVCLCVCLAAAEASEGGVVLREAKKFLIRYLKDVRTTQLALGRREVRVQGAGRYIILTYSYIG